MNLLFIGIQELIFFIIPLFYGCIAAAIFYGLYKVLSTLQNRSLAVKREHTAALLQQNEALKEIASAIRESNDKSGTTQERV